MASTANARMRSAKVASLELANLIDTTTYRFVDREKMTVEHFDVCAILSHRWQGKEIEMRLYQTFVESNGSELLETLARDILVLDESDTLQRLSDATKTVDDGRPLDKNQTRSIAKILRFCQKARQNKCSYVWADTCCIEADNAKKSKAFGSMWEYYSRAKQCYVYLSDVSISRGQVLEQFRASKWFTRGWTLQELLATYGRAKFYDCNWHSIDLGSNTNLESEISKCTNIAVPFLRDPRDACIAEKMSWLSGRETTLDEDMAYCMMGLFGVQISVNYSEGGENAFRRLQMALIDDQRFADDETIFAWTGCPEGTRIGTTVTACGLLAPWPSHFAQSGSLKILDARHCKNQLEPKIPAARNGVEIQLCVKHAHMNNGADWNIAGLAKSNRKDILLNVQDSRSKRIALQLVKNPKNQWRRKPTEEHVFNEDTKQTRNNMPLFVLHRGTYDDDEDLQVAKLPGFFKGIGTSFSAAIEARKRSIG